MSRAEKQPRAKTRSKKGRIRMYAGAFAVAELLPLAGGTALFVNAKSTLPATREKIRVLSEANINDGAATEQLTSHTANDKIIGGVSYRGDTLPLNPSDASGMVEFARSKVFEAKEREKAAELAKVRDSIDAHAGTAGYNFNNEKAELARIGTEEIVPQINALNHKVGKLRKQGQKGLYLALALPGTITALLGGVGVIKGSRKMRGWHDAHKRKQELKNNTGKASESANQHDAQIVVKELPRVAGTSSKSAL